MRTPDQTVVPATADIPTAPVEQNFVNPGPVLNFERAIVEELLNSSDDMVEVESPEP